MAIRKDANTLNLAEQQEFVNAVHALKQSGLYDQFVLRHANTPMSAIHRAPAFLYLGTGVLFSTLSANCNGFPATLTWGYPTGTGQTAIPTHRCGTTIYWVEMAIRHQVS